MFVPPIINLTGVYELKEMNGIYTPVFKSYQFDTPKKFYGRHRRYLDLLWSAFKRHNLKTGVILTGLQGTGKTEIGKELCNRTIKEFGVNVLLITDINYTPELLHFLESLENVVLFFDEFGKNFPYDKQEKMLTLLSNPYSKRRGVIITENEVWSINRHIRNRPGRLKYAINFSKLPKDTLLEYCRDQKVPEDVIKEIIAYYSVNSRFVFDHLKAIVEEWKETKLDIPTIVEILNIESPGTGKIIKILEAKSNENLEYEVVSQEPIELDYNMFMSGDLSCMVKIKEKDKEDAVELYYRLMSENIVKSDDNEIILKMKDKKFRAIVTDAKPKSEDY